MKQIGIVGIGLLLGLFLGILAGCDTMQTSPQEFASVSNNQPTSGRAQGSLSKAAYTATVYDFDGNAYVLTYDYELSGFGRFEPGKTTFTYHLAIGNLAGFHFALGIPECATVEGPVESVPAGNFNGNANGTLEFGPEDFSSSQETIYLTFPGEVELGVTVASFKYGDSGNTPAQVPILGPCEQGEYWITGKVFLDDPAGGVFGSQDPSEPGIGGVEVALFEVDGTPNQGEPTQFTAPDGSYAFHVLGPPVFSGTYRVELLPTGGGLNQTLFNPDGFWVQSDSVVRHVDLSVSSEVPGIGFALDIKKAIDVFETESSITDMLPWRFWGVQVTGTGSKKYKPVVDAATMDTYLETIRNFDQDLIGSVFHEGISLSTTVDLLQNLSRNDPQEELRTLTLAALFNFAAGRGACGDGSALVANPDPLDPIQFDVCSVGPDLEMTRLIIEQALVEWIRNAEPTVSKESGGSMSQVLGAMM